MSYINDNLGVQSSCFHNVKNNHQVAKMTREIGVDSIELCVLHADFDDPQGFKDIVKIYEDAGVTVVSIGVQTFKGKDSEKRWFDCAATAGAKHISAHFTVDTFNSAVPKTAKLAEEYDMKIGIHCHGGHEFGGQPPVIEHLIELGGPRIGLCLDTAWCMQIGPRSGNPVEWVKKFSRSIYSIHFKDFVFDSNAQWHEVVVGEGTLDLPAFTKALEKDHFSGIPLIEYKADIEAPVPSLKKCMQSMRSKIASVSK